MTTLISRSQPSAQPSTASDQPLAASHKENRVMTAATTRPDPSSLSKATNPGSRRRLAHGFVLALACAAMAQVAPAQAQETGASLRTDAPVQTGGQGDATTGLPALSSGALDGSAPGGKAVGPAATPMSVEALPPLGSAPVSDADAGTISLVHEASADRSVVQNNTGCGAVSGRIDPASEADYWTADLRAGYSYTVRAVRTSGNLDGWMSLYDPSGREVAYDDDSGGGTDPQVAVIPNSDGQWKIRVTSFRASSTGDYRLEFCEEGTASILPVPPDAPSDLRAEGISSSEIRLTWRDNSQDETGFKLFGHGLNVTVAANTTSYVVTGLAPKTSICYQVVASNGWGDSAGSNWSCGQTVDAPTTCQGQALKYATPVRARISATNRRDYCLAGDASGPQTVRVYADDEGAWLSIEVYDRFGNPLAHADNRLLTFNGNGRTPYRVAITEVQGNPVNFALRAERGRQAGITDGNRDCVVNAADYALMQTSLGQSAPDRSSKRHLDLNMDGVISTFDWASWEPTWRSEVGQACR